MTKTFTILAVSSLTMALTACATPYPVGGIWTNVALPVTATASGEASKTGEATCKSYVAMFSTGDCSIDTAKRNGGITKVDHIDWQAKNFLGLVGTYKVIVHGE
ncbi:TRL-like family protein [Methylosarcina fibrata]|uniref:TRL-like family protein n=1 Tax=Methylosarcina fibrata TaxID=105972 RepID=UPI000476CD9D|nr:TRL-like family protein [Methylosarcina fibrata]